MRREIYAKTIVNHTQCVAHPDLVEARLLRCDNRVALLRRPCNANNECGGEVPESSTLQTIAKHARRQHFDASPSVTGQ